MISIEALIDAISQRVQLYNRNDLPLSQRPTLQIDLLECQNHILAENVASPFDIPRQNLSAMDGYAIAKNSSLEQGATIQIMDESQAGAPYKGELTANQGVRIFTGAVVPCDCDTVVMQENTNFATIKDTIDKSQPYNISLSKTASIDKNIRKQGEEIEAGEVVLEAGKRLTTADISLLANLGRTKVTVYKPLVVGVLATGDELIKIGEPLESLAQIYNSNTPTMQSILADLPITVKDYGIIPDNLELTTKAVKTAMNECDVLISTAGVSVGDYDFLTTVIDNLGKINHYKVAMKPGKPFVFGELTEQLESPVLYFGLPGNPLSVVVGALQFVLPAIWRLAGVSEDQIPMSLRSLNLEAVLENGIKKSPGRTDFQRGYLYEDIVNTSDNNASQVLKVASQGKQDSHRIKQLSQANCLIVLPQDAGSLKAGNTVKVQLFPWS